MPDTPDTSPEGIERFLALAEKATPGPWRWQDWSYRGDPDDGPEKTTLTAGPETWPRGVDPTFPKLRNPILSCDEVPQNAHDATFISAARTISPALAEEVRRLRAQNAELRATVETTLGAEKLMAEMAEQRAEIKKRGDELRAEIRRGAHPTGKRFKL